MCTDVSTTANISTYHQQLDSQPPTGPNLALQFQAQPTLPPSPADSFGFEERSGSGSPGSRPSTASSSDKHHRDGILAFAPLEHCPYSGSRQSSIASVSTPASATSSIFPSISTVTTGSLTSFVAKSSGMSSPRSASEQCFTPATSTSTTSPSSAPHALGPGPLTASEWQQKKDSGDLQLSLSSQQQQQPPAYKLGPIGSETIRRNEGESLWWRRQRALEEAQSAKTLGAQYLGGGGGGGPGGTGELPHRLAPIKPPNSFLSASSSPWNGPKTVKPDTPGSSHSTEMPTAMSTATQQQQVPPASFSLSTWAQGSGLTLPSALLGAGGDQHDFRTWSSGGKSVSSTAASSPQQRWFSVNEPERTNGGLGLSTHNSNNSSSGGAGSGSAAGGAGADLHTNLPSVSSRLAAPTLMTTPSSPIQGSRMDGISGGADVHAQLDSLKHALRKYEGSMESNHDDRTDAGAAARSKFMSATSSSPALGYDPTFASAGSGFSSRGAPAFGRAIGNGFRSDGVWSASVSPSMTVQPLPPATESSSTATPGFGGSTPVPGFAQRAAAAAAATTTAHPSGVSSLAPYPMNGASMSADQVRRAGGLEATSRPRSATAMTSSAANTAAAAPMTALAMSNTTLTPAEIDQALASAAFLKGLKNLTTAATQSQELSSFGSGAVSPALGRDGHRSPRSPELDGHFPTHHGQSQQESSSSSAAAAAMAAAMAAFGLPTHSSEGSAGHHHVSAHAYGDANTAASALGLTTAMGTQNLPALSSAPSAMSSAGRVGYLAGHSHGPGSGNASLSAPGSAYGSPVTMSVALMPGEASQMAYNAQAQNGGGPSPNNRKLNLYKTEPCRNWEEKGTCRYGVKCQYAHGETELRPVQRHAKYKTEICRTFWRTGSCPYAKRCCFIHTTAADAGADFGNMGGPNAPLLARVAGDRQSFGAGSANSSMPNSPLVTMNRNLTGGVGPLTRQGQDGATGGGGGANGLSGTGTSAAKHDPLALSSLNDALAGINLGISSAGPLPLMSSEMRFRHQSTASLGGGSAGASFTASAGHGGHSHAHAHSQGLGHGHGHALLGSGPRFFKGPLN